MMFDNSYWSDMNKARLPRLKRVFHEATIMISIKFNGYYSGRKEDFIVVCKMDV